MMKLLVQVNKSSILHSFLFAIFPIIHLYSINIFEVSIYDIIFPIFVSVLITGSLLLLLQIILKDWTKSGFIISLLLILTFSYGHFYYFINEITLGELEFFRHRYLLSITLATFIIGTILIVRTQIRLDNLKKIINGVTIALIVMSMSNFAYTGIPTFETNEDIQISINDNLQLQHYQLSYELTDLSELNPKETPDVYYILLDGYGSTKMMKQSLEFDNYGFLSELTNKGFFAPDSSFSNYPSTKWSMSSTFSMNYLPLKQNDQSDTEYYSLISEISRSNEVMRNFNYLGYEIIYFQPQVYGQKPYSFVDRTFCQQEELNQSKFTTMLLRTTIMTFLYNQLILEPGRQSILCGFSDIPNLTEQNDKPIFVYMHLRLPHPPYVFGSNGEHVFGDKVQTEEGSFVNEEKYINSIKFANKKILEVIENILEKNEKSIIIIQSDHGYDFGINYENPSKLSLKQRFSNLNVIYLPNNDKDIFYEGITPINTFRIIFNEYFDTSYDILEDKMYYHPYGTKYVFKNVIFQDVTKIIVN